MTTETNTRTAPKPMSRQVIGLDVIRFAAALLVVAYHFGYWTNVVNASLPVYKFTLLVPYVRQGFVGVDIFFVLSGIVIAYSAEHASALRFAKSRVLRLYPTAWICSTITLFAFLYATGIHPSLFHAWFDCMVLSPFGPWIDGSYWTLGLEMSFYALLFLLLLVKRFRYLAPLMTLIGLISSAALLYAYDAHYTRLLAGAHTAAFLAFFSTRLAYLLLLHHGPLFALGVLLWLCFYRRFTLSRVACLVVSFAGSVLAVHTDWEGIIAACGCRFSSAPSLLLWIGAMVAIVLSIACNRQIARAVGPRGASLARAAGLATYPLYLIHGGLGDIAIHRLYPHVPYPVAMALCFTALLVFSFAVVPYADKPLQDLLKRFLHMPRRSIQPAASLP